MSFTFDATQAFDPTDPRIVAANAEITFHAVGDVSLTPLEITDVTGVPLPNPYTTNDLGAMPAFVHETLDQVAWSGGGQSGKLTSWEGLRGAAEGARDAAGASRVAAESAAIGAVAAVEGSLSAYTDAVNTSRDAALAAETAAVDAAKLVGAPADTAIATAINGPGTQTHSALSAAIDDSVGGRAPSPLTSVSVRTLGTSEPRPVAFWDGRLYGTIGSTIAYSTNEGATWTTLTTAATGASSSGGIIDMEPTADGEVIIISPTQLYKSSGWGTGNVTFNLKYSTNTAYSPFQPWSLDGNGTKFIAAQYNVGGTTKWGDSRYAHISLDAGNTWTIAYDTLAMHGAVQNGQSHLHGAAYDPIGDVFYLSEGHGPAVGIYVSSDNGTTWTRSDITENKPAHTAIVATPDGLVSSSDTTLGGTYGAARTSTPATMVENKTWAWNSGFDGTLGFGVRGELDRETGIVYFGFRVETLNNRPFIAASSVSAGAMVYEWPNTFAALGDVRAVFPVGNGRIVAFIIPNNSAPERYLLTATAPVNAATNAQALDAGQALGGKVGKGNSVAIGPLSTTGDSTRSIAAGVGATVTGTQDSTVYGAGATAAGTATAVGAGAIADPQTTAVGQGAKAIGAGSTAVGNLAQTTASAGTAMGENARAGNAGTAYGRNSEAIGFSQAFGYGAKALHAGATVLANSQSSTASNQVKLGTQHIELGLNSPVAPGTGLGRHFLRKDANGLIEACWRFPTGDVQIIASETNVARVPRYTSNARPAPNLASPGGMIYDITLKKPLWSDGTNWIDAMGTVIT